MKNRDKSPVFIVLLCLFFFLQPPHLSAIKTQTFNVFDYGAVGNGVTEDTDAFLKAWKATCDSSATHPVMLIPVRRSFLLQPLVFDGRPCKSANIKITIDGEVKAPSDPSAWKCQGQCRQFILLMHMKGLLIQGTGTINGLGSNWWSSTCKQNPRVCHKKPTGFILEHSDGVNISGLTFKDSPQMHIAFEKSTNVHVSNINIQAPGHSPNTDGIHIQSSQNIVIEQSIIGTGDDCISIGTGSSNLTISRISCGPGHGISIGSLGKHGATDTVEHVNVKDVVFTGTTNGARIKTWQGGSGYARNISFERIVSHGSSNPIIIDQFYCDHEHCTNQTSGVEVSDVTYRQISGTSRGEIAVNLACSKSVPCKNIIMENIYLDSTEGGDRTNAFCGNVDGRKNGYIIPNVPCLTDFH